MNSFSRSHGEDDAFRSEVRAFLSASLPSSLRDKVRDGRAVLKHELREWHDILNRKGWLVPQWPQEHGGTAWSVQQRWIYEEEYHSHYCPPPHLFNFKMIGPILIRFGTEEQKRYYLPRMRSSEDWWCQGYSEPNAGSDLASLKTHAVRDGDTYIVNGSKIWTSYAHWATKIFCLVRTDPAAKLQNGISFLLIDLATPGVTIRPIVGIDGRHHFNQVFFSDVVVPAANLVGEENRGWTIAKSLLGFERLNASRYGESLGRLKRLREMAAMPSPDGRRLADEDWFRRKVGEIEVDLLAVQFTALRFLARLEAGEKLGDEVSMLKLRGSQVLQRLQALMHQVVGLDGLAFAKEGAEDEIESIVSPSVSGMAPQRFFGRGYTIAAGSSEVQHEILAKSVLGLRGLS